MLDVQCKDHMKRVVEFAEKKGLKAQLDARLEYLKTYGDKDQTGRFKVVLGKDFAPASFTITWLTKNEKNGEYEFFMNGGMIYHGDQTGWDDKGGHIDPLTVLVGSLGDNPWGIHT